MRFANEGNASEELLGSRGIRVGYVVDVAEAVLALESESLDRYTIAYRDCVAYNLEEHIPQSVLLVERHTRWRLSNRSIPKNWPWSLSVSILLKDTGGNHFVKPSRTTSLLNLGRAMRAINVLG